MYRWIYGQRDTLRYFSASFNRAVRWVVRKPEYIFVILASIAGIVMIFAVPIFKPPDEANHFLRIQQVSQGGLISETINGQTGGELPQSILSCIDSPVKDHQCYYRYQDLSKKKFISFSSSALYSPVAYIPQAIGAAISRAISPSIYSMVIFGRILNLLVFVLFIFFAIKIAVVGKWVYVVVGLFPVAIQQAASLSSDVMTIGLCFLWIALLTNLYVACSKIIKRDYVSMLVIALGLALTKQTNILLLAGVVFLPKTLFNSKKQKIGIISSIIGAGFFAMALWYAIMSLNHYNMAIYPGDSTVNPSLQLSYMIKNPLSFIATLAHTYIYSSHTTVSDFIVVSIHSFFSNFSYKLPLSMCMLGYFGLILAFLYGNQPSRANTKPLRRLVTVNLLLFLLSLLAIAAALYIEWTPVGLGVVNGIQGRYFLPIIPLLIPVFILARNYISISLKNEYMMGVITAAISGLNLIAMIVLTIKWF